MHSIGEIDAQQWNSLCGSDFPFLRHEFLLALEKSGCTTAESGWQPYHAIVEAKYDDTQADEGLPIAGVMPLYLKSNSTGEYVFDWSWADAYRQHGLEYYPKLVTAIPFTPCAGPRICVHEDFDQQQIITLLASCIPEHAAKIGASSWHILFPQKELCETLNKHSIAQRLGCQYQWFNQGFSSFDHFLEKFSSRKRKNIRKERRRIAEQEIHFELLEGKDISPEHWKKFFLFYQSTYFIRGRAPYLSAEFFNLIGAAIPNNLLMVLAVKDGDYIAGALSFKDSSTLYGRYWGCLEEYNFLHFETCYYQGIDYCIAQGLQRFDSGAQGEHKIQRGFEPVPTWSNHWIARPDFEKAVAHFLKEEEQYINNYIRRAEDYLPFRKDLDIQKP